MKSSVDLSGLQLPEAVGLPEEGEGAEGPDGAPTQASFELQPLERGFGHTIGNSIRRIMLSSLPGAAVWAFRADGVQQEHQTVEGIAEDVHQIIQNLKKIVLILDEDEDEAKLSLSVYQKGTVKAEDIAKHGSVRVVNPGLVLFTVQEEMPEKRPFTMDLWVNRGRGFKMAEDHSDPRSSENFALGTIRIDSVYNPVTRANFQVRETRVGQRTDFDRLEVDVETNGALAPAEAVSQAAEIARLHLSYFSEPGELPELVKLARPEPEPEEPAPIDPHLESLLNRSLIEFDEISSRTRHTLEKQNIGTLRDVVRHSREGLMRLDNFGDKSLLEVQDVLAQNNLILGMLDDDGGGSFFRPIIELDDEA